MEAAHVTRFKTMFYDKGGLHYSYREENTEILEVNGRRVDERDGKVVFADTGELVNFN